MDRGSFTTVSDREHGAIIERRDDEMSMKTIAEEVHRSTATINNHIKRHNWSIDRVGFCEACRRVGSEEAEIKV
ncbi:MAG: helix-turn-helix domain-containing protein [Candidatus Bathyarchaeia archaeon]